MRWYMLSVSMLVLLGASTCRGNLVLDFATDSNNDNTPNTTSGSIVGGGVTALFDFANTGGGTGNIESFVQIQGPGGQPAANERAYNTPVNGTLNNGSSGQFNRNLTVGEIPVTTRNNVLYFEFLLDVNESAGGQGNDEFLSLDKVQIFTTDAGGQTIDPNVSSFSNEVVRYDMDADMSGNEILLDFSLNSGSGTIDMTMFVPVWLNPDPNEFIILYSEFGGRGEEANFNGSPADWRYSDGFEEWAIRAGTGVITITAIPEPGAFLLVGFIAGCVCVTYVRKRFSWAPCIKTV